MTAAPHISTPMVPARREVRAPIADAAAVPVERRFSIDEFVQMSDAGVFGPEERLELWDGRILHMQPPGSGHVSRANRLNVLFAQLMTERRAIVQVQSPIHLESQTSPQPDLALLHWRDDFYAQNLPKPEDIHLLIEVADSTSGFDRGEKLQAYARAGIPEYWIVEQPAGVITVCRQPTGDRYGQMVDHTTGHVACLAFPDLTVDVAWLLA